MVNEKTLAYWEYMCSKEWLKKREARLDIDKHRCRLCDHDGSRYQLEVHHKPSSYVKIPNESVDDDLTTLCINCHSHTNSFGVSNGESHIAVACKRCGNKWIPRKDIVKMCPKCKSYKWKEEKDE